MDKDGDFTAECSDEELFELTEKLLEEDDNNCARFFRYNLQSRRCGDQDVCDEPLFSDVDERLFEVETVKKLMALHDNYIPVTNDDDDDDDRRNLSSGCHAIALGSFIIASTSAHVVLLRRWFPRRRT